MRTMRTTMTACEWITERQTRCESAISKELERTGLRKPTIICVPKLESWERVCELDNMIKELRISHDLANRPLFKIPYYVNDVGRYTSMLFREHLKTM